MSSRRYLVLGGETSTGGGGGGGGVFAGPLHRDGLNLKTPDGKIHKYKAFTGFTAPQLWAKGEHQWVQDYIGQILAFGGNTIRVFCRWNNTGYCPESVPNYYDHFEDFMLGAKGMGVYVHVVGSCDQVDGSSVRVPLSQLHDSIQRLCDICRRVGNAGPKEGSNEDGKNGNVSAGFAAEWFRDLVATRSTWYTASNEDPETPGTWLNSVTVHVGGGFGWYWEGAKILVEAQKMELGQYPAPKLPSFQGEPPRIGEGSTPRQHADCAFHSLNFGAGSCVHGGFKSLPQASHHESDLQNCKMPTSGGALDCIKAVSQVWQSDLVNLDAAANGSYTRASVQDLPPYKQNDNECPILHWDRFIHDVDADPRGAGRSYFMRVGNRMYGGAIDPGRDWKLEPRLGYRLVGQGGYDGDQHGGNVLVLER